MTALDIIAAAGTEPCRPWPRHVLSGPDWAAMASAMALHANPRLIALWADTVQVHALLLDAASDQVLPVSVAVEAGHYAGLSRARPGAAWFERLVHDLWGHAADGGVDLRPWLDHGRWPHAQPLSPRPGPPSSAADPPEFLATPGDGLMQVPRGPVHGLVEYAAHVRLTTRGETVLRGESRLGYTHKGTLALMRGKSPRAAARFAARLAADATVAHALAFARATEAALSTAVPPRAATLRAVMTELERITGHLGNLAAQADLARFGALDAACGGHRERLLRAIETAFGHRLMMDCVVPGGIAADIAPGGAAAVHAGLQALDAAMPALRRRFEPLLARLDGLGRIGPDAAATWHGGGVLDARRFDPAYVDLRPAPGTEWARDAASRARLRLAQIADSTERVVTWLEGLPEGAIVASLPTLSGEGIGCAELVRGDVWHWIRLDHGQIAAAFPRDPAWALWPLAETALAGADMEEVDVILRSFGLSTSAVDL